MQGSTSKLDRTFSLLPNTAFTPVNIKIDSNTLYGLVKRSCHKLTEEDTPRNEECFRAEREPWWGKFLNLHKIQAIKPHGRFGWEIVTDGCGASITFKKCLTEAESAAKSAAEEAKKTGNRARKKQPAPDYKLEDFDQVHPRCMRCAHVLLYACEHAIEWNLMHKLHHD